MTAPESHALRQIGYLVIAFNIDRQMRGVLIDYATCGVACSPQFSSASETDQAEPSR